MDDKRIHEATLDCVDNCRDWDKPLAEISLYVNMLVFDLGWDRSAAHEVGKQALKLIDPSHPLVGRDLDKGVSTD